VSFVSVVAKCICKRVSIVLQWIWAHGFKRNGKKHSKTSLKRSRITMKQEVRSVFNVCSIWCWPICWPSPKSIHLILKRRSRRMMLPWLWFIF
jgi:hypothetical protein